MTNNFEIGAIQEDNVFPWNKSHSFRNQELPTYGREPYFEDPYFPNPYA